MLQSIGSDIEVFGRKPDGKHISLCGLIGGTKEHPRQIEGLPEGFMLQEDNVSCEFNIPACQTKTQWMDSIKIIHREVYHELRHLGFEISPNASVSFDTDQLQHPQAMVFGCEPDYNAWTMKENAKPKADDKNLRTAGGHVHVGSDIDMVKGVQMMDLYLGVPSVLIDDNPASIARRKLYGKSGAMRPKPYGWEYRVLSNFWIFNENFTEWVYNQTKICASSTMFIINNTLGKTIQTCIDTSDKKLATKLINDYGINYPG